MVLPRSPALCAGLLLLTVGCRRPPEREVGGTNAKVPPDRLAETEIAPGVERAFDLPLPRGTRIDARFGQSVTASVPASAEALANFVRRNATAGEAPAGSAARCSRRCS